MRGANSGNPMERQSNAQGLPGLRRLLAAVENAKECPMHLARRTFLLAAATLPFAPALAAPKRDAVRAAERGISEIERKSGGRLGVFVHASSKGANHAHRAHARFP